MTSKTKKSTNEAITRDVPSQSTLTPSGGDVPAEPIHLSAVMQTFMSMSKERQVGFYKTMLAQAAEAGKDVPDSTSAMNLKCVKSGNAPCTSFDDARLRDELKKAHLSSEEVDLIISADLSALLEEAGFDKALQQRCAELFIDAVELKETTLKNNIIDLLIRYGGFIPKKQIHVVDQLAGRCGSLEEMIAYVEEKNDRLKAKLLQHWLNDELTNEEILYGPGTVSSSVFDRPARKRCNIDEDMNGAINEEDYFTEKRAASNMLPYLASLERTSFKR